jgi:hypothetical protein
MTLVQHNPVLPYRHLKPSDSLPQPIFLEEKFLMTRIWKVVGKCSQLTNVEQLPDYSNWFELGPGGGKEEKIHNINPFVAGNGI